MLTLTLPTRAQTLVVNPLGGVDPIPESYFGMHVRWGATTPHWLRGATLSECRTQNDKLWICTLERGTRQARLVWNTTGRIDWTVPAQWQARQYETLMGGARAVPSLTRLQVDESPVLIVSDDQAWGAL